MKFNNNMLKKTLTSLVLGTSLLFGSAEAKIIDVYMTEGVNNLQSIIDDENTVAGDTLNFVRVTSPVWYSSATVNKDLNFEGNGYYLKSWDTGTPLTLTSKAVVGINNLNVWADNLLPAISVLEDASLDFRNSSTNTMGERSIYFNSTKNLNLNKVEFTTWDYPGEKKIYLENISGNIFIAENTFVAGGTAIYVGQDLGGSLGVMNNTINGMTEEAIKLTSLLKNPGYIINNSISNSAKDITNPENLGSVVYSNNNIEPVQTGMFSKTLAVNVSGDTNFNYDPMYVNPGAYDFRLQEDSPLWNKGLYVEGKTPWFPSENQTWIGAHGEGSQIPESGTLELLAMAGLSGLGYKLLRKKEKSKMISESEKF